MGDPVIIALDAGTTGGRCFVFNLEGNLLESSRTEWSFNKSKKDPMGLEFQPEEFWRILCDQIQACMKHKQVDPSQVLAISCTSMREAAVILGPDDEYLLATPAHDLRALAQGLKIHSKHRDLIYQVTGRLPPVIFALARLLWMKRKMKEEYSRLAAVLTISDWMNFKLSGEKASEPSMACETMLFDIKKREWSNEILNLFDLSSEILPPLHQTGEKMGELTKKAAGETGLKAGTPVVMAGADSQCGLLGMGLLKDSGLGIIAGSTAPLQVIVDDPILDSKMRTWTNCHILPNKWVLEANSGRSGSALLWFKQNVIDPLRKAPTGFEELEKLIEKVPPGSNGVWAFLGPMKFNAGSLEGLGYGGFLFPLPIAEENKGLPQFFRASYENMGYAFRGNYETIVEIIEKDCEPIRIGGGLSQSSIFVQIVADILDKPVQFCPTYETTALGAAICAVVGTKDKKTFEDAIATMVHLDTIQPGQNNRKYNSLFKRWLQFIKLLKNV